MTEPPTTKPPRTDTTKTKTRGTERPCIRTHKQQTPSSTTQVTMDIAQVPVEMEAKIVKWEYLHKQTRDKRTGQDRHKSMKTGVAPPWV